MYPTEFESLVEVCSESAACFGPVTMVVAAYTSEL